MSRVVKQRQRRHPKSGASESFRRRSQPRLCRPVIARDRKHSASERKISRVDVVGVQNSAGLKIFDTDRTRAHGAPLLLENGSLRQVSRVVKHRHCRGPEILCACKFLEATSAAPLPPRYCSRSGAFGKRTENVKGRCNRGPIFCGSETF